MPKLENAILSLHDFSRPRQKSIAAPALLLITLGYLVAMLSVPLSAPQRIVWFAIYPVITAEMFGVGFGKVLFNSLWVIPVCVLIGVFNPLYDTRIALSVAGIGISQGWVSFVSVVLRGLLAMQVALILAYSAGFYDLCNSLRLLKCPKMLISQLQFTYRYMGVILEEALGMDHARKARGFGKNSYPLRMWSRMVGQLLIRSYERASRIHNAMLARGFDGTMPVSDSVNMNAGSIIFLIAWSLIILILRFVDISSIFFN